MTVSGGCVLFHGVAQDIVGHDPVLGGLEVNAVGGNLSGEIAVPVGEAGPQVHQIALLLLTQLGQGLVQPLDVPGSWG